MTYALGSNPLGNLSCGYDNDGRRASATGTFARTGLPLSMSQTAYNANNQLTTWGTANLFYDLNGNMPSDGTHSYSWDARNRLTQIDSGNTATFSYDPLGRRTSKTVFSTQTGFLYDRANPVQELTGTTVTANSLSGGVDEVFQRTDSAGARSFLTDALGSTLGLTDSNGTTQTSYTFEPFGNTTTTGAATTSSFAYTGRELDATGLYYYRARYYNPQIQRFISEDPIGMHGGINVYAYVRNSPTNGDDPLGLWSPQAHDKILDHALSGCADPSDIKALQAASRDFDERTGGPEGFSPLHSMRAPWQSPQQALSIRDGFIQQTLSQAGAAQQAGLHGPATTLLGEAVHPIMDSTSLIHVDSNGNPIIWGNLSRLDDYFHSPGDWWGDETSDMLAFGSPRFNNMEDQIRNAYMNAMGGCTAGRKN